MNNPLVSIIIPCYNQDKYLNECLQSILDQTYIYWECIIINDGSTDDSEKTVEEWIAKDYRFKYFHQNNNGVSSARNLGLENAAGQFVQFLDSDDILDRNKIELSLYSLLNNKSELALTNFKTFSNDLKNATEHPGFLKKEFLNFNSILYEWGMNFNIPIHCGLFPIAFFSEFRFSLELMGNEDWMMWLCFFRENPSVSFVDKPLAYYRSHFQSATKDEAAMNNSYNKAIKHIESIVTSDEYKAFLFFLVSQKSETIIRLQHKIIKYQKSTTYKILKKINENRFFKTSIKYVLKFIKK
jgi:glycosyltransferase involved in cell wall biosynthesis